MILDKIVAQKKIDLVEFKKNNSLEELKAKAKLMPKRASFKEALEKEGLSIIGELKKASPSKGIIVSDFKPMELLKEYEIIEWVVFNIDNDYKSRDILAFIIINLIISYSYKKLDIQKEVGIVRKFNEICESVENMDVLT